MTTPGKSLETHFFFELRSQTKVKILDNHPTKPLIAYLNINNILAIWDWERKTCLKCFNIGAIESKDLSRTVSVRSIRFLDKEILSSLFPNETIESESPFYYNSWLIVVSELKVYFYDYVSEKIEVIPANILENKPPKCVEIVDSRHLAIGCSDGYTKIFDLVSWICPKTLKGVHHKAINNLFLYKHPEAPNNRLVVSSMDGILGCWNALTEEPLFKFGMLKNGKQSSTANNQEELLSISFNAVSNQIATLSASYITVWNAKTGEEIVRYKNIKDSNKETLTEASFLHYGNLSKETMIGHGKSTEVLLFDVGKGIGQKEPHLDTLAILDFKLLKDYDKSFRIYSLKVHYEKPHLIFIGTNQGAYILSLMKTNVILSFISSPFYSSYITPQMIKEFTNEDGTVKKLGNDAIQKCQSYELVDLGERLPNIPILSISNSLIYCHLLDRTKLDSLPDVPNAVAKTILGHLENSTLDEEFDLRSSFDGKFFSIRYLKSGFFAIYAVTNKNIRLPKESDNLMVIENLHPVGTVEKIYSGCACSLEWHQEKNEFIALIPIDKSGKLIELKEKVETISKGGFFGGKVSRKSYSINTEDISKYVLFAYHVKSEGANPKVEVKHKNDTFTAPKKVFGGPLYGVVDNMTEADFTELLNKDLEPIKRELRSGVAIKLRFIDYNETSGEFTKVGKPMLVPEHLYWNLSSTILITAYRTSFFVFKYHPVDREFKFYQSIPRQIHEGFFWENIFFYTTETSIRMAIFDLPDGVLDMVIADDNPEPNYISEIFFEEYFTKNEEFVFDSIFPHPQLKPPGHIKIIGIYDYKLIVAGSREDFYKLELYHPFLRICLNLQFQNGNECLNEVKRLDPITWENVFDLFEAYDCQKEANELLGLMMDVEMKSKCVLKRSLLRNDKDSLNFAENSPNLALSLKESLGLEFFAHYDTFPKFDLTQTVGALNSNIMTALCKEQTATQYIEENPGLVFIGRHKNNLEQTDLKEYFEELISLGD